MKKPILLIALCVFVSSILCGDHTSDQLKEMREKRDSLSDQVEALCKMNSSEGIVELKNQIAPAREDFEQYHKEGQELIEKIEKLSLKDFDSKIKILTVFIEVMSGLLLIVQLVVTILFVLITNNETKEMRKLYDDVTAMKDMMIDKQEQGVRLIRNRYDEIVKLTNNHRDNVDNYVSFMVMYLSDYLGKIDDYSPEDIKQMVDLYYGDSDIVGRAIYYFKNNGRKRHLPYIKKAMERIPLWKPFFEQAIAEIEKREGTMQDS